MILDQVSDRQAPSVSLMMIYHLSSASIHDMTYVLQTFRGFAPKKGFLISLYSLLALLGSSLKAAAYI